MELNFKGKEAIMNAQKKKREKNEKVGMDQKLGSC